MIPWIAKKVIAAILITLITRAIDHAFDKRSEKRA
jgi:hypothetical protein